MPKFLSECHFAIIIIYISFVNEDTYMPFKKVLLLFILNDLLITTFGNKESSNLILNNRREKITQKYFSCIY